MSSIRRLLRRGCWRNGNDHPSAETAPAATSVYSLETFGEGFYVASRVLPLLCVTDQSESHGLLRQTGIPGVRKRSETQPHRPEEVPFD